MTDKTEAERRADWLDSEACGGHNWNAKMHAAAAELRRLSAALTAVEAERDAAREEVAKLKLAEEGAAEAFGVVVQDKRDLEAECKRLNDLLQAAYTQLRIRRPEAGNAG